MTSIFEGLFPPPSKTRPFPLQSKQGVPFWFQDEMQQGFWTLDTWSYLDFNQILVPASSRTLKVERAKQSMLCFA